VATIENTAGVPSATVTLTGFTKITGAVFAAEEMGAGVPGPSGDGLAVTVTIAVASMMF
jgi:hypothetical protein